MRKLIICTIAIVPLAQSGCSGGEGGGGSDGPTEPRVPPRAASVGLTAPPTWSPLGEVSDTFFARVLDQDGVPLAGQTLTWSSSAPDDRVRSLGATDGVGIARGLLVPQGELGSRRVFAQTSTGPTGSAEHVVVPRAVSVELATAADTVFEYSGSTAAAGLAVVVSDPAGDPLRGAVVYWSADRGSPTTAASQTDS